MKREVAPESVDRKEHSCWLARTFMKEKIMGEPTEVLSPAPVRWPAAAAFVGLNFVSAAAGEVVYCWRLMNALERQ